MSEPNDYNSIIPNETDDMKLTVEVQNLKSKGTSYFDFTTVRACARFIHEMEDDIYNGLGSRHIREVTDDGEGVQRSFIVYTSLADIEHVRVIRHKD